MNQGDLHTTTGRKDLFRILLKHPPRSVWYSPVSGPWSSWSNLNGSRSVQAWDELQETRILHLIQVALGTILMRHQIARGKHIHWEQPQRSHMLKLPYLQEVRYYLKGVDVDLCVAGQLVDPVNQKPILKTLTIFTTSQQVIQELQQYRCPGTHDHQQLSGHTMLNGKPILRTHFSARMIAKQVTHPMPAVQVQLPPPWWKSSHPRKSRPWSS